MNISTTIERGERPTSATNPSRFLVVAPLYIPTDPADIANKANWINYQDPTSVIGYDGMPRKITTLFNRMRLDIPLALKARHQTIVRGNLPILAHNEAIGLPLAVLKRLGLLPSDLHIYSHSPLSEGPAGIKSFMTRFGTWNKMICLSEEEALAFAKKYEVNPDRVEVNPTPINLAFYKPQPDILTDEQNPFIFTSGVSHRDYGTLVKALGTLPKINGEIDPSSPSDQLKDEKWNEDLPDNIQIRSYPTRETIRAAIGRSRFVVVTIQEKTDQLSAGCTLATLAAAMEKPIIAATNGLRTYIKDGETGILVPPGEPAQLADAIQKLWNNPEEITEMGKNARRFAEEQYSDQAWVRRFETFFQ